MNKVNLLSSISSIISKIKLYKFDLYYDDIITNNN